MTQNLAFVALIFGLCAAAAPQLDATTDADGTGDTVYGDANPPDNVVSDQPDAEGTSDRIVASQYILSRATGMFVAITKSGRVSANAQRST